VLRPLEALRLQENDQVQVTVESVNRAAGEPIIDDPFAGIRFDGPADLAERFDDCRFTP